MSLTRKETEGWPTPEIWKVYDLIVDLHKRLLNHGITPKYVTMHPAIWRVFEENAFRTTISTPYGNLDIDIREDLSLDSIYVTAEKFLEEQPCNEFN